LKKNVSQRAERAECTENAPNMLTSPYVNSW